MSLKTIREPDTEILIVDDSVQYSGVLTKILKQVFGYERISTVDNPDEGLARLESEQDRYKLVFIDYRFPCGKTGLDLLKSIRDAGLSEGKVFFMITSEPTVEIVKEASSLGAVAVVAKPFDRGQLTKQLEKAERLLESESEESW